MQIDLVIDDFGVHGHPYVFDTVRWRLSCSLQAATASTWLFWNQAGRGRKAAGWRNAEIEHNTPRCVELGGGARARKFYLAVKNEFLYTLKVYVYFYTLRLLIY